jgi:hypothetical protein
MLKDVRHLACVGLVTAGAAVAVALAAMAADDEQFKVTTIVPLPHSEILSAFDISWVDKTSHTLAVAASRVTGSGGNVAEIIIVDTQKNIVTKELQATPPFAGACSFPGRNTISGPNGVITIEKGSNTDIWAGDGPVPKASSITKLCVSVNPPAPTLSDIDKPSSVKVLDLKTGATKAVVFTGNLMPGTLGIGRADELCYNPISDVVLVANDEPFDNFITFIGEDSYKVLDRIRFDGTDLKAGTDPATGKPILANGIEQCQFNPRDGKFYLNIPMTGPTTATTPGDGVVVRISAHAPFQVEKVFPISSAKTGCFGPQGMAIGPDHQIGLGCGGTNSLIIDDRDGSTIQVVAGQGGTDENWYNPGNNHYFFARSGTAATGGFLGVEDAGPPPTVDTTAASGFGSHSVAADPIKNQVYVPIRGNSGVAGSNNKICGSASAPDGTKGNDSFGCIAVFTAPSDKDDCRVQGAPGQALGGRCHSKQADE